MVAHGLLADAELRRDLVVVQSARDMSQHLSLAHRQGVEPER
jgi:hypothetical protein